MSAVSRTEQITKLFSILEKHYEPVAVNVDRPVLETLLFACCLEDAHHAAAEEAFAAVVHTFFDWNEVRVTSIAELSETLSRLPNPRAASNRLKRILQSVFEESYSFDLEERRKQNLGPTIKWLKELDGTTNFTVAFTVQASLGGHAIPVGTGVLRALRIVDLVADKDVEAGAVPGIERAVAKSKGREYGSIIHQFGADFVANPYTPKFRKMLLEIEPGAKERLPKRRTAKKKTKAKPLTRKRKSEAAGKATRRKKSTTHPKATAVQEKAPAAKKKQAETKKATSATAKKVAASKTKKKPASQGLAKRKPR